MLRVFAIACQDVGRHCGELRLRRGDSFLANVKWQNPRFFTALSSAICLHGHQHTVIDIDSALTIYLRQPVSRRLQGSRCARRVKRNV